MAKFKILITQREVFYDYDIEIDIKYVDSNGTFHGDVTIDGNTISGEHGKYDYMQFGFELGMEEELNTDQS